MCATATIKVDSYSARVRRWCRCPVETLIYTLHSMCVNAHLHMAYLPTIIPPVLQLVMFDLLFVQECTNFIVSLYSVVLLLIMSRRKCLEPSAQE